MSKMQLNKTNTKIYLAPKDTTKHRSLPFTSKLDKSQLMGQSRNIYFTIIQRDGDSVNNAS